MSANLIIGIVFPLVGLLLVAIAVFIFVRTRSFIASSQEVKGTILRNVYRSSSDGGGYAPVFGFTTIDGRRVEVQDMLQSNPPQFREGEVVNILYDPQEPGRARIKKWSNLYFVPLLLSGMGLIFGGIGLVLLIFEILDLWRG
ncbi:MAG: DUF3592 domain-containing protein [Anaerolineales bacterium]|nr:DUF3592 domain-containing protein [Anaerolineales bacterium]